MGRCLECGEEHLEGALFCGECGANLWRVGEIQSTLAMPVGADPAGEPPARSVDYRLGFGIKADRITFIISSSGRRLSLDLTDEIAIGRADARQDIWPEVDLTLEEGAENGVSRRHALVRNSDEGVVVIDLGSTNGTRVNDRLLTPERPHLLRDGDLVYFGRLRVQVQFETKEIYRGNR